MFFKVVWERWKDFGKIDYSPYKRSVFKISVTCEKSLQSTIFFSSSDLGTVVLLQLHSHLVLTGCTLYNKVSLTCTPPLSSVLSTLCLKIQPSLVHLYGGWNHTLSLVQSSFRYSPLLAPLLQTLFIV